MKGRICIAAEAVAREYRSTGDLDRFIRRVSDLSVWYGRFSRRNRAIFIDSLLRELKKTGSTEEK